MSLITCSVFHSSNMAFGFNGDPSLSNYGERDSALVSNDWLAGEILVTKFLSPRRETRKSGKGCT